MSSSRPDAALLALQPTLLAGRKEFTTEVRRMAAEIMDFGNPKRFSSRKRASRVAFREALRRAGTDGGQPFAAAGAGEGEGACAAALGLRRTSITPATEAIAPTYNGQPAGSLSTSAPSATETIGNR